MSHKKKYGERNSQGRGGLPKSGVSSNVAKRLGANKMYSVAP